MDFDVTIIGGGVIGLAIARRYSNTHSVLLVEQHDHFGAETSARNSEVIHAGLYYPAGSLKESLCLQGKQALYMFCQRYDVPHQTIGKLIVSPVQHHPKLDDLQRTADRLGIPLQRLDRQSLQEYEPNVRAEEALYSPTTGIIDSHQYLARLEQHASGNEALLMQQTRFVSATAQDHGWRITLDTSDGLTHIHSACLINAAGLSANRIAAHCGVPATATPLYPCQGQYFAYQGKAPFRHLVYPLPEPNLTGLGIHATLDLAGATRFGPDAHYLDHSAVDSRDYDYRVNQQHQAAFAQAIQRYFPTLEAHKLQPDYSGMRPKLHSATESAADFSFVPGARDQPPALHLLGIESPGLTASLAIAQYAQTTLQKHFT